MPKTVYGDLYVHRDYLHTLPGELQKMVFEAIPLIPKDRQWNLVRVNPVKRNLTFSLYPNFEENPHPELKSWTKIDLLTRTVKSGSYTADNPFILHHKETFIDQTNPLYQKFRALSAREEQEGLYLPPHNHLIGRKKYWEEFLFQKSLVITDHRLLKGTPPQYSPPELQMELLTTGSLSISRNQALTMSGKTAMHRREPSLPAKILVEKKVVHGKLFDWGCGHGTDLTYFQRSGIKADGWDPNFHQDHPPSGYAPGTFAWVYCGYVLNTLPDPADRSKVLQEIYDFLPPDGHLAISVRSLGEIESVRKSTWKSYGDGWITPKGTFQKGFTSPELTKLLINYHFTHAQSVLENPAIFSIATK